MTLRDRQVFLDRYRESADENVEDEPILAAVSHHSQSPIPQITYAQAKDSEEQPFLSSISRNIGDVQIESFRGSSPETRHIVKTEDHKPVLQSSLKKHLNVKKSVATKNGDYHFKVKQTLQLERRDSTQKDVLKRNHLRGKYGPRKENCLKKKNYLQENDSQNREDFYELKELSDRKTTTRKGDLPVIVAVTPEQRIEEKSELNSEDALDTLQMAEQIGRGAHGIVYKALNKKTNQLLAVKVMKTDKDELAALMGEIDLLKVLKHPNIVKYHGFVKTPDTLNVILEYCSGGSLRQLYKRLGHGLPEQIIVYYAKQILEGLNYLHQQGVVHRDVKAANVLLTDSGEVKLADFGVATTVAALHNTVVGTPHWMAPETVLGGDGSCTASDIWSLGATIIELLTTNPPFHHLVPMAAIHAIVNHEHPPLPPALSAMGQKFLLECFQKTPGLRKSASLLLQHRWLHPEFRTHPIMARNPINKPENVNSVPEHAKYTRAELLLRFQESKDDELLSMGSLDSLTDLGVNAQFSQLQQIKNMNGVNQLETTLSVDEEDLEDYDHFSRLDVGANTKESEKESEMVSLLTKLTIRIKLLPLGDEEVLVFLTKITGRIYSLVKKYPDCAYVLLKDHGVINFMQLLDYASEYPREERLWHQTLGTLNCLFRKVPSQVESFAMLGGIPIIIQFSKPSCGMQVKSQVAKIVKTVGQSQLALRMFIASDGLRILSRFLLENVDTCPEYLRVAVWCIHEILTKDLSCSKSDLCQMLSKHGVFFSLASLLGNLTGRTPRSISNSATKEIITMIIDIINTFGLAGAKVQVLVSSPALFKVLLDLYDYLSFTHQLILLKFFRALSSVPEIVRQLVTADILHFYVSLLARYPLKAPDHKEVLTILCPSIYQCCNLNHERQTELVKLGAVPYLRDLCTIDMQIRQFVFPVIFELVHCDVSVRLALLKADVPATYFALLGDPYWSYNAMDSLFYWGMQDPCFRWLDSKKALTAVTKVFLLNKILNLEAFLDIYYQVMAKYSSLVSFMTRNKIVNAVLMKLASFGKSAPVAVTLLKILHRLLRCDYEKRKLSKQVLNKIMVAMRVIANSEFPVLASSLATKIINTVSRYCS